MPRIVIAILIYRHRHHSPVEKFFKCSPSENAAVFWVVTVFGMVQIVTSDLTKQPPRSRHALIHTNRDLSWH
jgi:hypothetical protein